MSTLTCTLSTANYDIFDLDINILGHTSNLEPLLSSINDRNQCPRYESLAST